MSGELGEAEDEEFGDLTKGSRGSLGILDPPSLHTHE